MKTQTDFEEWARLLIARKVPQNFSHLIDSEVIDSGADILKRGDAFEVHWQTEQSRVYVTPMPATACTN